jgi:pimeloyl-ACP methyl ester carboxylesterase
VSEVEATHQLLHGERIAYRRSGDAGPVVLLIHGMAAGSRTWDPVLAELGDTCQVVAPDLLGHGDSDKPAIGDYSLGAYANSLRDLLAALGHERATVVGHSLGGGVALQFAYQFPERCERLVLVSSGGLGREVNAILRAATVPGFAYLLQVFSADWFTGGSAAAARLLRRVGLEPGNDARQSWLSLRSLRSGDTRAAFLATIRSVIAAGGQRVSAVERLYLAAAVPTLLVWGDRDRIIPVDHAHATHERIPGSRLEIIPGAGHYPHRDDPDRFVDVLLEFLATTEPADLTVEQWRQLIVDDGLRRSGKAPT